MAKTAKKEAFDKKVAAKAMKLMKEGKPRKQAFAIAYGMVGSSRKSCLIWLGLAETESSRVAPSI